jgi:hypothetical protein
MAGQYQSASIQFLGSDNVKQAFQNVSQSGVINWAIFNGKALLEKYEGDDQGQSIDLFNQYVDALENNGTTSLYRLQTYEDLPAGGKIKPSTEPDRSFQFKLYDAQSGSYNRSVGSPRYPGDSMNQVLEKLNAMEAKIALLEKDDGEDEEKVSGFGASIMKFLEIPAVQQKLAGVFENLIDQVIPLKPKNSYPLIPESQQTAATMNGVPSNDEQIQIDKINLSIQKLYEVDKKLGDNLERLAAIAVADPSKYRFLVAALQNQF